MKDEMKMKHEFLKRGGWNVEIPQTDRGVTLIETMIAVLVALIGVFGLGSLIFQATVTNKNQGTEVTRATVFAQDKMEKLLSFGSAGAVSGTAANFLSCNQLPASQPIACNSSGITGSAWDTGLYDGGPVVTSTPVTTCPTSGASVGYVDFLDANGSQMAGTCAMISASNPAYSRMWQITTVTSGGVPVVPTLKQVTVGVWALAAINAKAASKPVIVITSYISDPN
jgi:hypothetical protein